MHHDSNSQHEAAVNSSAPVILPRVAVPVPSRELFDYAYKKGWVNDWHKQFYDHSSKFTTYTEKQAIKMEEITNKINVGQKLEVSTFKDVFTFEDKTPNIELLDLIMEVEGVTYAEASDKLLAMLDEPVNAIKALYQVKKAIGGVQ